MPADGDFALDLLRTGGCGARRHGNRRRPKRASCGAGAIHRLRQRVGPLPIGDFTTGRRRRGRACSPADVAKVLPSRNRGAEEARRAATLPHAAACNCDVTKMVMCTIAALLSRSRSKSTYLQASSTTGLDESSRPQGGRLRLISGPLETRFRDLLRGKNQE